MKKPLFLLSLLAILVFTTISQISMNDKIIICHIPPGNPDNAHAIEVSINALKAHLAHGDSIGDCKEDEPAGIYDDPMTDGYPNIPTADPIETDEKDETNN